MKLEKILKEALDRNASDLYITTGAKPVFRIAGNLVLKDDHPILTNEIAHSYLSEIMGEANVKKFNEEKDVDFSFELPGVARFRANVFVQRKGIGGVFRLIPAKVPTMEGLGLPEAFKKIPQLENGLVLVTGPTGSGKSTTLAAIINEINTNTDAHIITIEDPIEFVYENKKSIIEQREVHTHTQSFQNALRATLREDPDVILVGEMRDLETISLAITAAETGHLVFATLHTSGAAKTIDRIINVFPGDRQSQARSEISEALRAVIWKKLIKKKDGGIVGVHEILFINTAAANLIRESKTHQISSVIETGAHEGMETMEHAILSLLRDGVIAPEEAAKHIPPDKVEKFQKQQGK